MPTGGRKTTSVSLSEDKRSGALWGLSIGDALAMPVHWYYNRNALHQDYGWVTDYLAPRNPHPDSILFRSHYTASGPKGEILHDQKRPLTILDKAGCHAAVRPARLGCGPRRMPGPPRCGPMPSRGRGCAISS